ncbi:hypothetical protein ACNOYE_14525 [Nannocystaceae bacterium ST9]
MHRNFLLAFCVVASCTSAEAPKPAGKDASKSAPNEKSEPAKPPSEPKLEPIDPPAEPKVDAPVPMLMDPAQINQVLGAMQTRDGLTLQVHSGGCRKPADITFGTPGGTLTIDTIAPDTCDMDSVLGTNLVYPWHDLPSFLGFGINIGPAEVVEPGSKAGPSVPPEGAKDEAIYGVLVTSKGLDVRVSSGGCTELEHFTAYVEPGDTQLVHLVRTKPDMCEVYVAEGELLSFTWEQLGVTKGKARLVNPFQKLVIK